MDTPQKIGRYEIVAELGRGAMGTVYRAKDPAMDRVVALKTIISVVLESHEGNEFRERFYREARAAGGLTHPGIVPVFDVGEHEGVPYMVMEFISGRTLADSVSRGERLSIDRVCEMGQKIAEALGYAHQHGVVHRDIKPANILLTSREAHGIERPKITDFGVAKMAEGQTTRTGQMVGTPAFMPPEQFTGAPIDGRADIFSLGVVLYWLATGEQPFPGDSLTAVSYKVVHTEPVPPSKLNPAVPAGLENLILKCMAKNPEERYQTGEELARDLGQIRSGTKTPVVRTTAPQRSAPGIDPDATVFGPTLMGTLAPAAATRPAERAASPQANSSIRMILIGMILAAIVAAGGWYAMSGRKSADTPRGASPCSDEPGALGSGKRTARASAGGNTGDASPERQRTQGNYRSREARARNANEEDNAARQKRRENGRGCSGQNRSRKARTGRRGLRSKNTRSKTKRQAEDRRGAHAGGAGIYVGDEREDLSAKVRRGSIRAERRFIRSSRRAGVSGKRQKRRG